MAEVTLIATTLHPAQILEEGTIPVTDHDFPLDLIVSPDELIRTETRLSRPSGIIEEQLDQSKREGIPALRRL